MSKTKKAGRILKLGVDLKWKGHAAPRTPEEWADFLDGLKKDPGGTVVYAANAGVDHVSFNGLTGTSQILFTAYNENWQLVQPPVMRFSAAGGANFAATLVNCANGTAVAAGTAMLAATMSLVGAADTNVVGALSSSAAALVIPRGASLGIKFSGTLGGFANGVVTFGLRRITGLL